MGWVSWQQLVSKNKLLIIESSEICESGYYWIFSKICIAENKCITLIYKYLLKYPSINRVAK